MGTYYLSNTKLPKVSLNLVSQSTKSQTDIQKINENKINSLTKFP